MFELNKSTYEYSKYSRNLNILNLYRLFKLPISGLVNHMNLSSGAPLNIPNSPETNPYNPIHNNKIKLIKKLV